MHRHRFKVNLISLLYAPNKVLPFFFWNLHLTIVHCHSYLPPQVNYCFWFFSLHRFTQLGITLSIKKGDSLAKGVSFRDSVTINVAGAKGKMNYWLLLVRKAVLVSQRYYIWYVVYAEEDGQHEHLIIEVVE